MCLLIIHIFLCEVIPSNIFPVFCHIAFIVEVSKFFISPEYIPVFCQILMVSDLELLTLLQCDSDLYSVQTTSDFEFGFFP